MLSAGCPDHTLTAHNALTRRRLSAGIDRLMDVVVGEGLLKDHINVHVIARAA